MPRRAEHVRPDEGRRLGQAGERTDPVEAQQHDVVSGNVEPLQQREHGVRDTCVDIRRHRPGPVRAGVDHAHMTYTRELVEALDDCSNLRRLTMDTKLEHLSRLQRADPPRSAKRRTGVEHDQIVSRSERVRRAGHRLDGETAPLHVRPVVARVQHQVAVGVVDPEDEAAAVVGVPELDPRDTVLVSLEPGERGVEPASRPIGLGRRKSYCVSSTAREPVGIP